MLSRLYQQIIAEDYFSRLEPLSPGLRRLPLELRELAVGRRERLLEIRLRAERSGQPG